MKLEADFSKISTDFEALPNNVYRVKIMELTEGETKENKLPSLSFEHEVQEGEFKGRKLFDFVTLKQKDGKPNNIGLGRVKAYAAAILGDEAANAGAIDTDAFKGSIVEVVVEIETYTKTPEKGGGEGKRNKIVKVLKAA